MLQSFWPTYKGFLVHYLRHLDFMDERQSGHVIHLLAKKCNWHHFLCGIVDMGEGWLGIPRRKVGGK